jgi:hypothetical protein
VQDLSEDGLVVRRELGGRRGIADALAGLGEVALAEGDAGGARDFFARGLAIRRELGERHETGLVLQDLARAALAAGDPAAARDHLEESLTILQEIGARLPVASCLERLSELAHTRRQPEHADYFRAAAVRLRAGSGSRRSSPPPSSAPRPDAHAAFGRDRPAAAWAAGHAATIEEALRRAKNLA